MRMLVTRSLSYTKLEKTDGPGESGGASGSSPFLSSKTSKDNDSLQKFPVPSMPKLFKPRLKLISTV